MTSLALVTLLVGKETKLDRNKLKLAQPLQHNLLCHPFAALCLRRGSNHCTDLQVDGEI